MISINIGNFSNAVLSCEPKTESRTSIDYIDIDQNTKTFTCPDGYDVMVSVDNNNVCSRIEVYKNGQFDGLRVNIAASSESQRIKWEKMAMRYVVFFIDYRNHGGTL